MTRGFVILVDSRPRGQERARHATRTTRTGKRVSVTYTPTRTRVAVQEIRVAWMTQGRHQVPTDTPFSVSVEATMRRPSSHTRKDGSATRAYREAPRTPDVDNILKLVLDALQPDCITDDALCVDARATKAYGADDALRIHITWDG